MKMKVKELLINQDVEFKLQSFMQYIKMEAILLIKVINLTIKISQVLV